MSTRFTYGDGPTAKDMTASYDEEADIMYLSLGEPCPAVTWEDESGLLVRLDPETRGFVGLTVVDYVAGNWRGYDLHFHVPGAGARCVMSGVPLVSPKETEA